MPSHPDRVRANYHTAKLRTTNIQRENALYVSLILTKQEIASWIDIKQAILSWNKMIFMELTLALYPIIKRSRKHDDQ